MPLFFTENLPVIERLSPFIIYIHPPESFYHEFRGSGGYFSPLHQLNNDLFSAAERFFHFGDIYFRTNETTGMDIGHYQFPFTNRQFQRVLYNFYVFEQGMYYNLVIATKEKMISFYKVWNVCRVK